MIFRVIILVIYVWGDVGGLWRLISPLTGTWTLNTGDCEENGVMIGKIKLPMRVIQEGWYKNRSPQTNARVFFNGHAANRWIKNLGMQLSSQVNQMVRLSL